MKKEKNWTNFVKKKSSEKKKRMKDRKDLKGEEKI